MKLNRKTFIFNKIADIFKMPAIYTMPVLLLFFSQKNACGQSAELTFSHTAGWYIEAFQLNISIDRPNAKIYYTLNGELPDTSSMQYDVGIFIDEKKLAPTFSAIPTAPEYWQAPQGEVFQITTLRVAGFLGATQISPYYTLSFSVNEAGVARYPFPVVSLVTDGRNLFDATQGIHVAGDLAETDNLLTGNYYQRGREWERPAHFEYFEVDGTLGISQDIGCRIHGQYSRQLPQKSMRLYARDNYGAKHFKYPFFQQKNINQYKRLVLRAANPNNFHIPFKDELCHLLIHEMGLDYQAFTPVIAFVNGEYWGIFNLKERHDRYYIQSNYEIDDDDVDMLERSGFVIDGEATAFEEMMDFVQQNDLSTDENYEAIKGYLDIDNFIDFVVAELYLELWDFPENNLKYWRERTTNAQWNWLFNDGDSAMHEYWKSKLRELLTPLERTYKEEPFVILLKKLLSNKTFKERFYQRFLYHLNHTLSTNNVLYKIDSLTSIYDPVMPEHIRRWAYPATMNDYHAAVAHLRQFAALRPAALVADLKSVFGQPFTVFPNPTPQYFNIRLYEKNTTNPVNYTLYNALGQQVLSGVLTTDESLVDVSGLTDGIYFLYLGINDIYYTIKLVKM